MDLGTGLAIVGGIAATVYVVETVGKYGYSLLKKNSERPLDNGQPVLPRWRSFQKKIYSLDTFLASMYKAPPPVG